LRRSVEEATLLRSIANRKPNQRNDPDDRAEATIVARRKNSIFSSFLWAKGPPHGLMNSNRCISRQHHVTQKRGHLAGAENGAASFTQRRSPRRNVGNMIFQLPSALADETIRHELERSSVTGGQDNMPYPTDAVVEAQCLIVSRCVKESGNLQVPWRIEGAGQLMTSSATLMERAAPYQLAIELARGKINQVRTQIAEWTLGGLLLPDTLAREIHDATAVFGQALMRLPD